MADIQISATGGDVTAQTSIQTSRGVAAADTLPVQDGVERLSPHEREEMSEMEVLGLQTEFPIIVCSLAVGTDAIIGTDVLGSVLPHALDIKNGLLFAQGGASLQLHRRDSALSGRVFTVGHSSIPPYSEAVLHCSVRTTGGRALPSSGLLEGLTLFAEETGLIVGRTLVDPSGWKVPVLVSNFSQKTHICITREKNNRQFFMYGPLYTKMCIFGYSGGPGWPINNQTGPFLLPS